MDKTNGTKMATHKESENYLGTIFMQAPVAICIFRGPAFIVEMANEKMLRFWDRASEQVLNKPVFESMPDLTGQGYEALLKEVYETGNRFVAEETPLTILRHSKREEVFIKLVYEPMREQDGTINAIMAMAFEITEQVMARRKLEESNNRYNAMLMQSPFAFSVMKGKDMVITVANDLMKEFWGKGKEVEGKTLLQVLPELKDQPFPGMIDSVYTAGNPVNANEILARLNHNGKLEDRYFNIIYQPYVEADETISGVITIAHEVTNQVVARKKIEESEYRYQNMIYSSPSLIAILRGENHIITIANDAIIEVWGKGKGVIGKPFLEAMPELVEQGVAGELHKVYTTGIPSRADERPVHFLRKGKVELRYYSYVFQPQRTTSGEIEGIAIIGSEVTSQALANKAVKESEKRLRNLVEQAPTPILILKGENMIMEVANEPVFKIFKVEKEALGKPFLEILPEMKDQPVVGLLLDVFRNGVTHYGSEEPVYFIRKNGEKEIVYFNFTYQPYWEDDGSISGVMVLANDVTGLVVARKKMEAQATMVSDLLMTAPGFVATLVGPEHVYGLVNKQYQAIFGKRKLQGKALLEALPELEGQGFNELLDHVYTTGETYVGIDIPIVLSRDEDSDPELSYFNFSYQPMYDENKKIFSILVFGYEVTEQVLAKNKSLEEHEEYATKLEEKVKERTLELSEANKALNQKNEELIKMNQELKSFTYVSSHDLQEPLRKIQTFAARMQTLIQDLLAYSQTSITDRKLESTNLQKILEEVKDELAEAILEKQAVIESSLSGEVSINPFQFRQVLYNLISNALKFSLPGVPPHIKIGSETNQGAELENENLSPEKLDCHIYFSDNGIGFDAEYKEKIFEVFQRLHGKEEYAGTGIGLAIVKKIVENHNGVITASGELGKGARFDIYFPE